MQNRLFKIAAASLIASTIMAGSALAQSEGSATPGTIDPNHPRVNEIDQRLENQQQRIENGEKNGTITPGQAARDEKRDARIQKQAERDEAKHGGHLTKREQRRMNRELNHNSRDIHRQHRKGERRERHERHEKQ